MAEFKLGRLRFVWKNTWTNGTAYLQDDVIRYGGKSFVCVIAHTAAADFYTDFDASKWQIMTDGFAYRDDWTSTTLYRENDIVKYGGIDYICIDGHTSNAASTINADLAKWDVFVEGFKYRGSWAQTTAYKLNDIVKYEANVYLCTTAHVSSTGFDPTKFDIFVPGLDFIDSYDNARAYVIGDIVTYGGYSYTAVQNTTGNTPSPTSSFWDVLTTGFNPRGVYNPVTAYKTGDLITYGGNSYVALLDGTGQYPDIAPTYWQLVNYGVKNRGTWTIGQTYFPDEIVLDGNSSFICVQRHTASSLNSPAADLTNIYWAIMAYGDAGVLLTSTGDLLYRNPSGNTRLPIGTDGQLLSVNSSGLPEWLTYGQISNVIYVSSLTGTNKNTAGAGRSLQRPFKSVRYALNNYDGALGEGTKSIPLTWTQGNGYTSGTYNNVVFTTTSRSLRGSKSLTAGIRYSEQPSIAITTQLTETLAGIEYVKTIGLRIIQNLAPVTVRTGTPQNTSLTVGETAAQTTLTTLIDTIKNSISTPATIPTAQFNMGFPNAAAILVANKTFIKDEVIAYINATYPSLVYNPTTCARDVGYIVDAIVTDMTDAGTGALATVGVSSGNVSSISFVSYGAGYRVEDTLTTTNAYLGSGTGTGFNFKVFCVPATMFIKTGVYDEILPMVVWPHVALVGDSLRGTVIQPAAGYATSNMFYVRNAAEMRNMTLQGLTGTLSSALPSGTNRPSAGAYVSLDPGSGAADDTAWITAKSPYVQNVTTFGTACTGLKVDGSLHNGGNRSIVANDFTQVLSDGIGVWLKDRGVSECVSVFTYFCAIGYLCESGGKLRATNGNNSYGRWGSSAEGYDLTETPLTAGVNNRSNQAQVARLLMGSNVVQQLQFSYAGETYSSASFSFSTAFGSGVSASPNFVNGGVTRINPTNFGTGYTKTLGVAQAGNTTQITLAITDINSSGALIGKRISIVDGVGYGQTGIIKTYDAATKVATIVNDDNITSGWTSIVGASIVASLDFTSRYEIFPRIVIAGTNSTVASAVANVSNDNTLDNVYITNAGSGYITPVKLLITGGGGNGALGTATLTTGGVASVSIGSGGIGYSGSPIVTFSASPGGVTATGTANVSGGRVTSVTVNAGSTGYTTPPTVSFSGGGGAGAVAAAILSGTGVASVGLTNSGIGYTSVPTATVSGGGSAASGAFVSVNLTPTSVASCSVSAPGTGFTTTPTVVFVNNVTLTTNALTSSASTLNFASTAGVSKGMLVSGSGIPVGTRVTSAPTSTQITIDAVVTIGSLTNISFTSEGTGATALANLTATSVASFTQSSGGSGYVTQPTVIIGGSLNVISLSSVGTSYTQTPTVEISAPNISGGIQATATATRVGSTITAITVTQIGTGYTVAPIITIVRGVGDTTGSGASATATLLPGAGATAAATINAGQVIGLVLIDGGNGYTRNPVLTFVGGGGSGAAFTSNLTATTLASVTVTLGGNGYTSPPGITFSGGGGSAAAAFATLTPTTVQSVNLNQGGTNYVASNAVAGVVDPSATSVSNLVVTVANGVIGSVTFASRGSGYVYNTTAVITVSGNGYAEIPQIGDVLRVTNIAVQPRRGSTLSIGGNAITYLITNVSYDSPSSTAVLTVSPNFVASNAPVHNASCTIRQFFSQVRLTGHDLLNIGTGNVTTSNYPNNPLIEPDVTKQYRQYDGGRVFYTSTDQDGNFSVGGFFGIDQATGQATLSVSSFNLTGLNSLQIGDAGATVTEFSTDGTFTRNSDLIIPTEKAIRSYISSQLGSGGSNLTVNALQAGNVIIQSNQITTANSSTNLVIQPPSGATIQLNRQTQLNIAPSVGADVTTKTYVDGQITTAVNGIDLTGRLAINGSNNMTGNLRVQKSAPQLILNDTSGYQWEVYSGSNQLFFSRSGTTKFQMNDSAQIYSASYGWFHDYFLNDVNINFGASVTQCSNCIGNCSYQCYNCTQCAGGSNSKSKSGGVVTITQGSPLIIQYRFNCACNC